MATNDPYATPTPDAAPPPAAPPAGQQQSAYGAPQTANNGLGTAALVLGIIAVVLFWTIIVGFVCGLLGLIFGIIGRKRANRREATNGGAALAGAITGGLAVLATVAIIAVGAAFFEHHKKDFQNLDQCLRHAQSQHDRQQCQNDFNRNVSN